MQAEECGAFARSASMAGGPHCPPGDISLLKLHMAALPNHFHFNQA